MPTYSKVVKTEPHPTWPQYTCICTLSCGHQEPRPRRDKPYLRLVCETCHPPPNTGFRMPYVPHRSSSFDAVRQARGTQACSRWGARNGKSLY